MSGRAEYAELEARFKRVEPRMQAFLPEPDRFQRLLREFEQLERQYPEPNRRPALFGLPVGVKDIFHAAGFDTHAGSELPAEALAGPEAESVRRLKEAGALVLGKTVTTEFAYYAPGPTRNPHNPEHTPGGSSSGSAAAVAARLAPLALGTQTIGSINRPAAFCGVVGFKPSFGRISTAGVIPLSPSLDHVGYFTRDVPSSVTIAPVLIEQWTGPVEVGRPRLAVPTGPYLEQASPEGRKDFERTLNQLEKHGLEPQRLSAMPDYEHIAERHRLILAAEAAQVHEQWFAAYEQLYADKTAELIRRGQTIATHELEAAKEGRQQLRSELHSLMEAHRVDLWISPSAVGTAPRGLESTGDPAMNLPWTHAGLPTITLTSGWSEQGLPYGIQLTAAWGRDEQLLAFALGVEPLLEPEG